MNLANAIPVKTPDLVSFTDPTIQTDNVLNQRRGGVTTRISDKDRIWEPKPSDIETAATHDEIKNKGEKLTFRKYIKDLDFETIKMLEQEHEEQENIKEIYTQLSMARIDEQKMKNIEERENIDNIPTGIEMIRSEHSSTSKCEKHGPKVNSEPDLPPYDSSDSSSSSESERTRTSVRSEVLVGTY